MRRSVLLATAIVALASPASADTQSEDLFHGFLEWVDSSPLWAARAKVVTSEGEDTVVRGFVFELEGMPAFSSDIGELRFTGFGSGKGGGFAASAITMTDLVMAMDPSASMGLPQGAQVFEYSIPSATITDISMPSFAGVTFDMTRIMSSVVDFYALAAQGEFAEVNIPLMSAEIRQSMPGTDAVIESSASYHNMVMTGFGGGVLQSQTIGPIETETTAPGLAATAYTIESIEAGALDWGALVRIFDETQYAGGRGDGVWTPVISHISYSGISASGPDFTFALADISLDSIEARQLDQPFTQDLDLLFSGQSDALAPERLIELGLGFYSAWRVGTFSLTGLDVDAPSEGAAFALGNFTIANLSSEGIERIALDGASIEAPEVVASLESFELTGFVFPNLASLMFGVSPDLMGGDNPDARDAQARAILDAVPRFDHIGLHGLSAGLTAEPMFKLETFTLDFSEWNEIFAGATDLVIDGLEISRNIPGLDAQTLQMMDQLGYDRFVFGASLTDRWSPEEGRDEAVWTLSLQEGADIEVSYALTGLTAEWVIDAISAETEAAQMKLLSRVGLESATVRVADRSLLDRAFELAAQMQGMNVDGPTYREQIRGAIPFMLSTAVPEAIANMVGGPLQAYVGGGQVLVAQIAPPEPVTLFQIINASSLDPGATAEILGLTVSTEPATPEPEEPTAQ